MEETKPGILPFLYPQSLSWEEVERRLGRPLAGDPTRGERGVVAALGRTRIDAVRRSLEQDGSLGAEFKELIRAHLAEMEHRWHTSKAWRVQLPGPIWEEYARESRVSQRTIAECLSAAIQRDYERRMHVADPLLAVAAASFPEDLSRRLQRIEDAISSMGGSGFRCLAARQP